MRVGLVIFLAACAGSRVGGAPDAASGDSGGGKTDDPHPDAAPVYPDTLDGNRDRLLHSYFDWLKAEPNPPASVCDLWNTLTPSARDVFLTISHRMFGSTLADGSHMLSHVTKLYRVAGGQGATATSAGSCGGGEYNRMILSQDSALHAAQLAASTRKGAAPYDLADLAGDFWRDSHDVGGPHAPFDLSDETNNGAPRGQTQYFRDPTSSLANSPLGRMDLTTLVDPYALEIDQDYDCTHNSNPDCQYIFYGPACAPASQEPGTQIYTQNYGAFEPAWKPSGC